MTSAPAKSNLSGNQAVSTVPAAGARSLRMPAGTEGLSLLGITTLTLWLTCLTVGGMGMVLHYARAAVPAPKAPPVVAELLNVQLTPDQTIREYEPPPPPKIDTTQPPPLFTPPATPQAPPLTAVAQPTPAIAFALPVEGPVRVVEAKQADFARPAPNVVPVPQTPPPPVQSLTFGQGDGRQPEPTYPDLARRLGHEGVVVVRFSVGANGRVIEAAANPPCPWPLLNNEAVRTVRDKWRFKPGPVRLYEVPIRFQLR